MRDAWLSFAGVTPLGDPVEKVKIAFLVSFNELGGLAGHYSFRAIAVDLAQKNAANVLVVQPVIEVDRILLVIVVVDVELLLIQQRRTEIVRSLEIKIDQTLYGVRRHDAGKEESKSGPKNANGNRRHDQLEIRTPRRIESIDFVI